MKAGTITVPVLVDTPRPVGELGTLSYALHRRNKMGWDLIVERTDFQEHMGEKRYYAIRSGEKRLWTPGEREITQGMITEAWYAQDCPDILEAI